MNSTFVGLKFIINRIMWVNQVKLCAECVTEDKVCRNLQLNEENVQEDPCKIINLT